MYSCSVHYVISPKGLTWYPQPIKMHIFLRMPYAIHPASSASFCLDWGGEKQALPESCQTFEVAAAQTSGLVNRGFEYEYPFIDKPMVITEHAVAIAQLLGLGSKLYPINMPRMPNKDLTRFMQSLSWVRQNQANKRKALLAGCIPWHELVIVVYFFFNYNLHKRSLNSCFCLKEKMEIARWKQVNVHFD